jgi:fructosamine-3-kinase
MGALLAAIGGKLGEALGGRVDLRLAGEVGGGCIHRAFRATDGGRSWFVKVNDASRADLFAAEADGLRALAQRARPLFSIPPPTTAIARSIWR